MQNTTIISFLIVCLSIVVVCLIVLLIRKTREIKRLNLHLEETKTVAEIKIRSRTKELEELADSLDGQVKKRTKELEEKIKDLEKIKRLSIGRELKMIELKKEIKSLKKEIKKIDSKNEKRKEK